MKRRYRININWSKLEGTGPLPDWSKAYGDHEFEAESQVEAEKIALQLQCQDNDKYDEAVRATGRDPGYYTYDEILARSPVYENFLELVEFIGERVEVYSAKDEKAAMGVFIDDTEIACPVIPYDKDGWLKDWSDGDLNCAEAERRGITPDKVSEIIARKMIDISKQILDKTNLVYAPDVDWSESYCADDDGLVYHYDDIKDSIIKQDGNTIVAEPNPDAYYPSIKKGGTFRKLRAVCYAEGGEPFPYNDRDETRPSLDGCEIFPITTYIEALYILADDADRIGLAKD